MPSVHPLRHVSLKDRALSANDERRLRLPSVGNDDDDDDETVGGKNREIHGKCVAFSIKQTRGN